MPGLAGADLIFQWIGMVEYIPSKSAPALHWGLLAATRLASREILIEQNIKKQTGPTLYGPHPFPNFHCTPPPDTTPRP
jgi:hypothetical protein